MQNQKPMSVIIFLMYMGWISGTACVGSAATGQSASQAASLPALLQKYIQALDATQSFVESYEEVCDYKNRMPGQPKAVASKRFARGQIRSDGRRIYLQDYYWGDFSSRLRDLPESTPRYHLRIDADGKLYAHSTAVNDTRVKGTAALQPARSEKGVINMSSYSGIHGFLGSEKRLDAVLRGANRISVRPTTEKVNGSPCHVIDADTQYGCYSVWLDPAHGYNAAKITRKAVGGQKEQENVIPRGDRSTASVLITRFEQVDGVWMPVESEDEITYASGMFFRSQRDRFKRTKITLNPDHDKLGSFDNPLVHPANDSELNNATRVSITLPNSVRVKATWKDGKVIDESGQVIDVSKLWPTTEISLLNMPLPALTEPGR